MTFIMIIMIIIIIIIIIFIINKVLVKKEFWALDHSLFLYPPARPCSQSPLRPPTYLSQLRAGFIQSALQSQSQAKCGNQ